MGSYDLGKAEVVEWVKQNFPKGATCLDVGACDGKWHSLLGDYLTMDAVEIFQGNITKHELAKKYRRVFWNDIERLDYDWYDLIIFGDVIEHMYIGKAQRVISNAKPRCKDMIIAVPWRYKQGAIYGNPYEYHVQDDLMPEIFEQRYPGFEPIWQNEQYAYFHKK